MSPEGAEYFAPFFNRAEALIKEGKLPDDVHIFPRFAYCGHKTLHGYEYPDEQQEWRCVVCMTDWKGNGERCSNNCDPKDNIFRLNHNRSNCWECISCGHVWDGEIGWKCPKCRVIKDAPCWKHCDTEWYGEEGKFCPKCGGSVG